MIWSESGQGAGFLYLIPMVQYKDRWQELTREDFRTRRAVTIRVIIPKALIRRIWLLPPLDFSSYYEEEPLCHTGAESGNL